MIKLKNTLLTLTLINVGYLLFSFIFNPYNKLPFLDYKHSFQLPVSYVPFGLSIISVLLFIYILLKSKTKDWFIFFIISINLLSHIASNYYYAEASDWMF